MWKHQKARFAYWACFLFLAKVFVTWGTVKCADCHQILLTTIQSGHVYSTTSAASLTSETPFHAISVLVPGPIHIYSIHLISYRQERISWHSVSLLLTNWAQETEIQNNDNNDVSQISKLGSLFTRFNSEYPMLYKFSYTTLLTYTPLSYKIDCFNGGGKHFYNKFQLSEYHPRIVVFNWGQIASLPQQKAPKQRKTSVLHKTKSKK